MHLRAAADAIKPRSSFTSTFITPAVHFFTFNFCDYGINNNARTGGGGDISTFTAADVIPV